MIRRPPRSTLFPIHNALPISMVNWLLLSVAAESAVSEMETVAPSLARPVRVDGTLPTVWPLPGVKLLSAGGVRRSEEQKSELQSQSKLVCRLLLVFKRQLDTS